MSDYLKKIREAALKFIETHPEQLDDNDIALMTDSQRIHELSVYQVELEMQNDELRYAQQELLKANDELRLLFHEAPTGYVVLDKDFRIKKANRAFLNMVTAPLDKVIKRRVVEFFNDDSRYLLSEWLKKNSKKQLQLTFENKNTTKQATKHLKVSQSEHHYAEGEKSTYLTFTEVTELVEAESKLKLSAAALNAASEGCLVVDQHENIIFINPAVEYMMEFRPGDLLNKPLRKLLPLEETQHVLHNLWALLASNDSWQGEVNFQRNSYASFPCEVFMNRMSDTHGHTDAVVLMLTDITERKNAEALILRQATIDSLTGLPNRSLFLDRLEHAISLAQRTKKPGALMFMDLDGFKYVNDSWGHAVGDELLKAVGQRLQESVRGSDTIARIGGDEFVLIFNDVNLREMDELATKVLNAFKKPFELTSKPLEIGASVGVTLFPTHSDELVNLMKFADKAMYVAKRLGKGQYTVYNPT